MKLQVVSDIHLEFLKEDAFSFIDTYLHMNCVDGIILAGDISSDNIIEVLNHFSIRYKHVFFVPGNHDFYGKSIRYFIDLMSNVPSNVYVLDNTTVTVEGITFIGSTLWFPETPYSNMLSFHMNDFRYIKGFKDIVYSKNKESMLYLRNSIIDGSVVITHHLPCWQSVPDNFLNSSLNIFYVCDMCDVIRDKKPKFWIHGHTHTNNDYKVYNTNIISNPYGYYGMDENIDFEHNMVIDV